MCSQNALTSNFCDQGALVFLPSKKEAIDLLLRSIAYLSTTGNIRRSSGGKKARASLVEGRWPHINKTTTAWYGSLGCVFIHTTLLFWNTWQSRTIILQSLVPTLGLQGLLFTIVFLKFIILLVIVVLLECFVLFVCELLPQGRQIDAIGFAVLGLKYRLLYLGVKAVMRLILLLKKWTNWIVTTVDLILLLFVCVKLVGLGWRCLWCFTVWVLRLKMLGLHGRVTISHLVYFLPLHGANNVIVLVF
jgi:hypothetical protein